MMRIDDRQFGLEYLFDLFACGNHFRTSRGGILKDAGRTCGRSESFQCSLFLLFRFTLGRILRRILGRWLLWRRLVRAIVALLINLRRRRPSNRWRRGRFRLVDLRLRVVECRPLSVTRRGIVRRAERVRTPRRRRRAVCTYNARRVECCRPRRRRDRWMTAVGPCKQRGVSGGLLDMLSLYGSRCDVGFRRPLPLLHAGYRMDTSGTAVVTDAVDRDVIDHGLVVDIVHDR